MYKNTIGYASFHINTATLIKEIGPSHKTRSVNIEERNAPKKEIKIMGLDFKACGQSYPIMSPELMFGDYNGLFDRKRESGIYNKNLEFQKIHDVFMIDFLYESGRQARALGLTLSDAPRVASMNLSARWVMGWHQRDTELSATDGVYYA